MKISYSWLKWYVPEIPEADKLADVFTYHLTEVEGVEKREDGDFIFDLNILPNRAHDLLSHHGVARELAGQLGIAFNDPTPKYKVPPLRERSAGQAPLEVKIEAPNCRRYSARIVRNVKIGPSPEWVKNHLESIGQRSINNIVDATNLVMFDCGQPCHAFDLDKLVSEKIIIRQAGDGESITTLSGTEVKLLASDMVIADGKNTLAIAGVKGGKSAEVDENTKNILIEVANFDSTAVRKTARRLNILTDSSKRFENDLSAELCNFAMTELSGLLIEYGATEFEEVVDVYPNKQPARKLSFSMELVNKKLGSNITALEIENILKRYSYTYTQTGNTFEIVVPPMRLDIVIPEDMVEEIGRVYGYENVLPVVPQLRQGSAGQANIEFKPNTNETFYKMLAARQKLLDDGYSEVMTYGFTDKGDVEVLASASDKNFLRTNLSDGLKHSIKLNQTNAPLLGVNAVKVFEIGTVFSKDKETVHVAYGDKKSVTEMTLDEYCEKNGISPDSQVFQAESSQQKAKSFTPWSPFPFIARDIAVWVPEGTDPSELTSIFKEHGTELMVTEPRLFDTFSKEGRTSLAFSLVFQAFDRTLTDEEVNKITEKIYASLKSHSGWEIR